MRKIIFFLSICIISLNLHPQELFIEGNTNLKSSNANAKAYLEKGHFIQSFSGKINMSAFDGKSITLTIPDGNTQNFILKEKNHEKWIGVSSEGSDNMVLVINNGTVYGMAFLDDRIYQICSFEDYTCILSEVDRSVPAKGATPLIPKDKKSSSELRAATSSSGNIRVLVAYTNAAAINANPNIFSIAKLAIELTNQSYVNSRINHKLELAACIPVNYTEVAFDTDLGRLQNKTDGFMDEVHQFRDIYSADVCILLSSIPEWVTRKITGVAYFGPSIDYAFGNVHYPSAADWTYTFAHELGHTQGADHDIAHTSSKNGYDHGYVSPDKTWRTIMAYGNDCGWCTVALHWSNPDVLYKGVPTGTVALENNARVLNENIPIMKGFRAPSNDLTISSAKLKGKDYIDAIARNQIQTSGTVYIPSGNEIRMRAGNSVILNPGFSLDSGSTLQIDITTIE